MSDKELVSLYKESGDLAVLGQLYQRYMELVYGVCLKYFKDAELSKDAVMQIFEELVSKLRKHEVDNFKGWLHQVAKNHCLMQLRTPRNLKTVEFKTELVQSEENLHLNGVLEKEENFQKLEHCIGTLAEEQHNAIRMFYLEGKSYHEIAEITGKDWNQIRSSIQNGRRNLKICMEKTGTTATSIEKLL
ncbi:MAG: RNA polymerase subunit sigma-70 [Citrobacter freundii]|nr:MAG: RNA polymerase subunit sigma-70 [Citrobacter freundii]